MRLIDADKLMLSLADWELQEAPIHTYEKPKEFTADDMQRMIWRTIRDCESAVEEQPTVRAIPIEWLQQMIEEDKTSGHIDEYGEYQEGTTLGESCEHVLANWYNTYKWKWENENEKG